MMLLGDCGVGKSATGNVILGREAFGENETTRCEIQKGKVERRNISVIDTPGINSANFTPEQWRNELRNGVTLASPGPQVFLLVTKVDRVSEEDNNAKVTWIRENLGEAALKKFSMILFIGREEMTSRQWAMFCEDARTRDLLGFCGGRYSVINSKREGNSSQILKLLMEIESVVQQNGDQFYSPEMFDMVTKIRTRAVTLKSKQKPKPDTGVEEQKEKNVSRVEVEVKRGNVMNPKKQEETVRSLPVRKTGMDVKFVKEDLRRQEERQKAMEKKKWLEERGAIGGAPPDPVCDVRIVLLGGVGAEKSSSGNTILGRPAFRDRIINVPTMGQRQDGTVGNKSVTVIDTKAYNQKNDRRQFWKYCDELEQCLPLCSPGPHVFILVVPSPTDFSFPTGLLYERFGPEVLKRTLILITRGDNLGGNRDEVLKNNLELRQLVQNCGDDYHVFNNRKVEDRTQVVDLLEKIEALMKRNGQGYCTTQMFQRKGRETSSCTII